MVYLKKAEKSDESNEIIEENMALDQTAEANEINTNEEEDGARWTIDPSCVGALSVESYWIANCFLESYEAIRVV